MRPLAPLLALLTIAHAIAQTHAESPFDYPLPAEPTPLAALLHEAQSANPRIAASLHASRAAEQVPTQVSTLPDPQITVQQFSVGSPRPFAGFTNSDFAYIGVGVSQDIPYPGKLRLRGEAAAKDAEAARDSLESERRAVAADVKDAYAQLAYLQTALTILAQNARLLDQIEQAADARYRSGSGNQQEVLKAQLQQTRLLAEAAIHHRHIGEIEARLKQLLNRPPGSSDIRAAAESETPLPYSSADLLARVPANNPDVGAFKRTIDRRGLQVELAHKDFLPDFTAQYMWQHTASQYRDYYMLTFGARIPIYRSRKQRPELFQAEEDLESGRRAYEAQLQQTGYDVTAQFLAAQTASRVLKIYREGLLPQAKASLDAGLAAYQSNRQNFDAVLNAFLDLSRLDEEYWQTLAQHESAIARLEQLTGVSLP